MRYVLAPVWPVPGLLLAVTVGVLPGAAARPQRRLATHRIHRTDLRAAYQNLLLTRTLEDGVTPPVRLVIHSYDDGPGDATLALYGLGRRLDFVETRAVEGVRFIEREGRRPLVEVHSQGHGTGLKYHDLVWYCVDRDKLEVVLTLTESANRFVYGDPHAVKGESRIEHEDSQMRILASSPSFFRYPPWPVLRVRTTEEAWYEDDAGNLLRTVKDRVTDRQYVFDPKTRTYRATSPTKQP
jgi:hypothetical protein